MTLKESVLLSLNDINEMTNYFAVYNNIVEKIYCKFNVSNIKKAIINICKQKSFI